LERILYGCPFISELTTSSFESETHETAGQPLDWISMAIKDAACRMQSCGRGLDTKAINGVSLDSTLPSSAYDV
jgi:hypothetical protein